MVAEVVESVQVTTPVFAPVVTVDVADVLVRTVIAPVETPETPDGVNVGALDSQAVPEPVHVTKTDVFVSTEDGETDSVDVTNAGL